MGSLCSCLSTKDKGNFSTPGRIIDSAPPTNPNPISKIPSKSARIISEPPRVVGGMSRQDGSVDDARRKAAEAAEARAQSSSTAGKGKLAAQLAQQKKQTRSDTLNAASEENRRLREMDASKGVVKYD